METKVKAPYLHTQCQFVSDNKLALYIDQSSFVAGIFEYNPSHDIKIQLMDWLVPGQETIWEGTIEELATILRDMKAIKASQCKQ